MRERRVNRVNTESTAGVGVEGGRKGVKERSRVFHFRSFLSWY
jgi:hypothetical protein